eukprot:1138770-Pelagomonas_calceolata.AAC.12
MELFCPASFFIFECAIASPSSEKICVPNRSGQPLPMLLTSDHARRARSSTVHLCLIPTARCSRHLHGL